MYNWNIDDVKLKQNPEAYARFRLEQLVNFGLDGEKLSPAVLKQHWTHLSLDPHRKQFLELLLYGRSHSHQTTAGRS